MPTPADERMDGILSLIRANRAEFARIFDAVANVHDPEKVTLRSLVQVARLLGPPGADASSDRAAFGLALRRAAEENWFETLLHRLVNERALTEPGKSPENEEKALRDWIGAAGLPKGEGIEIELQAKVNPADGYLDPLHVSREMQLATRRICQVIVEGERRGTGFLVGPQTVLTNWHVVQELMPPDQTSLAKLGDRLTVKFDRYRDRGAGFDGRGRAYAGRSIDLASSAYPEEYDENHISGDVAAPWAGEEERLDFALIRLDGLPGLERGWYRLRPDLAPGAGSRSGWSEAGTGSDPTWSPRRGPASTSPSIRGRWR